MLNTFIFYDLFDRYETLIFMLQQKLYLFIELRMHSFSFIIALILLCSGIMTSFNPCFISIIPLTISYINMKQNSYVSKNFCIFGVMSSFLFMIFLSHFINFYSFFKKISLISSSVLFLVSLNLLQVIDFSPFLSLFLPQTLLFKKYNSNIESYLIGFFIGMSSVPCSTPLIIVVIWGLSHILKLFNIFVYLIIYLCGCFIPLIIIFNLNKINLNLKCKSNYMLFFIREVFISFSGSLIFISSFLCLLKRIYV